jgi:hypothetical protein
MSRWIGQASNPSDTKLLRQTKLSRSRLLTLKLPIHIYAQKLAEIEGEMPAIRGFINKIGRGINTEIYYQMPTKWLLML